MARRLRIEKAGFYHIVNRGVEKRDVFLCHNDYMKFLEIANDASEVYNFQIFSYCLMKNHYHLLLKTNDENLSLIMRQINSRYSIYFNKKYKRVGHLWQGRFKSWYVWDEMYLQVLIRYIEHNPVKAGITKRIGRYKWAMSSKNSVEFSMLNSELLDQIDLDKKFDEKEQEKFDEFCSQKLDIKDDLVCFKKRQRLDKYFVKYKREEAIFEALKDGYTQSEIARHLTLSNVSISKILKTYKKKLEFFKKLKDKGLFWSYSKEMRYDEELTIEYVLKYADFDDIVLALKLFGKRKVKKIWEDKMQDDKRFIKVNLMIARVFFGMDVEADYFKDIKSARSSKLRLLAS